MAGQCIEKLPHKCGSSNGLQTFYNEDGTYSGYCYVCRTKVLDPYGDNPPEPPVPKTQEQIDQD